MAWGFINDDGEIFSVDNDEYKEKDSSNICRDSLKIEFSETKDCINEETTKIFAEWAALHEIKKIEIDKMIKEM